jgi:obg-like ATPase 1
MSAEEKAEEEKNISATSALGKITQAGYTSLDVSSLSLCNACFADTTDTRTFRS